MEKLTLIGFSKYYEQLNKDLFEFLELPEGIDKELLVDNILLRGGEFEVLFADPDFVYNAIKVWSKKWYRTFEKWFKVLEMEYNPLENYDRFEDFTDTGHNTSNVQSSNSSEANYGSTQKTADTTTATLSGGSTSEASRSAYDSSTYQPHDKSQLTYNNQKTTNGGEVNITNGGKDESSGTGHTDVTDDTLLHKTGRAHGNIGVTTSQQMLQAELDVQRFSLYDNITDLFLREFVIPVY